jgi:hypothetical protein
MIADPLRDNALLAVELGALGDTLDDHIHLAVGLSKAVGEDQLVRRCAGCLFPFPQPIRPVGSGTTRSSQFFGVKRQWGCAFTRTS